MNIEEGNRMTPLMAVRCCFESSAGLRSVVSDVHIFRIHHEAKEIHFFTGAYDSDRKPVYEADILEVVLKPGLLTTKNYKTLSFRGVVRYSEHSTCFSLCVDEGEHRGTYSVNFGGSAVLSKKVIGNLWTSPELLQN